MGFISYIWNCHLGIITNLVYDGICIWCVKQQSAIENNHNDTSCIQENHVNGTGGYEANHFMGIS